MVVVSKLHDSRTPCRCVVCLVASLFVGQLLFVLVKAGSSVSPRFCAAQAAAMHYAFTAAFLWMNVMAVDVYRTFGGTNPATAPSASGTTHRNPNSCLNYLLPPKRDTSVTSRLRAATPYRRPTLRTKKYCSFINYGLSHYQ